LVFNWTTQLPRVISLSADESRRLALASLGFGARRPTRAGRAHVRATAARLGAIQIDSVNVLARAHYLPTFSRYGPYQASALDDLAHGKRELFEYWGHAACFLPLELYPLLRWRMDGQAHAWAPTDARHKAFIEAVYREVADRGPISAGEITFGGKSKGPWWGWSDGKSAVELLFTQGRLAIAGRRNFERLYDLPERVLPRSALDAAAVPEREAKKRLLVRAASAMGVGTARDIAQYFHVESWWDRRSPTGRRPAVKLASYFDELVEEGRLERAQVEGWREPAFVIPGTSIPRSMDARAIVSPFDPIMWERRWTKTVFGFEYQIEIYVPAPKRVHGYYVLPFLAGDRFGARVDLKADRKRSTLIVHAAYLEPGQNAADVSDSLADELRALASWLALDAFSVGRRGNLSAALRRALK
jgi:uncharacterized protein YcaQ